MIAREHKLAGSAAARATVSSELEAGAGRGRQGNGRSRWKACGASRGTVDSRGAAGDCASAGHRDGQLKILWRWWIIAAGCAASVEDQPVPAIAGRACPI